MKLSPAVYSKVSRRFREREKRLENEKRELESAGDRNGKETREEENRK